jgi:hypothetical protein
MNGAIVLLSTEEINGLPPNALETSRKEVNKFTHPLNEEAAANESTFTPAAYEGDGEGQPAKKLVENMTTEEIAAHARGDLVIEGGHPRVLQLMAEFAGQAMTGEEVVLELKKFVEEMSDGDARCLRAEAKGDPHIVKFVDGELHNYLAGKGD